MDDNRAWFWDSKIQSRNNGLSQLWLLRCLAPLLLAVLVCVPAAAQCTAYVTAHKSNNVVVVDTFLDRVVAVIPVQIQPLAVAITPNGALVYVANSASNTVSVIGTATNAVMTTVTVTWAPDGVATTPDGAFAYVTNEFANTLSVVDTTTNTVVDTVQGVATFPVGIAIMHSSNMPTLKCR